MDLKKFMVLLGVIFCSILSFSISTEAKDLSYKKSITMYINGNKKQKKKFPLKTANGVSIKKIKYKSSKKKIATVSSNGYIYAKKIGKTTVTANIKYKKNGKTYTKKLSTKVTVKKGVMKLSTTSKHLEIGESFVLKLENSGEKRINWENDNTSAVKFGDYGKGYVEVKAVGVGSATITCTCEGKTYECVVTVGNYDEDEYYVDEDDGEF